MVYISEDVCRTGEEGGMMDGGVGGSKASKKAGGTGPAVKSNL